MPSSTDSGAKWWTILIGIVLALDGVRSILSATQGDAVPWLGDVGASTTTRVSMLFGAIEIFAGVWVLRAKSLGGYIGAALSVLEVVLYRVNRGPIGEWMAGQLADGRGRSAEDVESMLSFSMNFTIVFTLGLGYLFYRAARRFEAAQS